jgi:hypothetical protein
MNARELESAAAGVQRRRRRAIHSLIAAALLGVAAGVFAASSLTVAAVLGLGAAAQATVATGAVLRRRELISRLALDPSAYAIPEVARFGSKIAAPARRKQLAASIHSLVHDKDAMQLHLPGRARRFADQLDELARELAAPSSRVPAPIAVECRHLVTRPVQSPLYNPNLPEEDLTALLLRIRSGITSAE